MRFEPTPPVEVAGSISWAKMAARCGQKRFRTRRLVKVLIQTPAYPTEDEAVVEAAALAFMEGATEWTERDGRRHLTATGSDITLLRQRIWENRIIDSFRGQASVEGNSVYFVTSKQAASLGTLSLPAAPHALGDLAWTITVDDADGRTAQELLMWLCPETEDGEIVDKTLI
jgi:predicted RNA binding protein with dsRBD fold (UPF0201 family)